MTILIATDMEGATGVVCWEHTESDHREYPRFRRLLTRDVNAAIQGAFAGGADEVIVADGHGGSKNILIEELDPRARLNCGTPSPLSMVQGIGADVDAVFFVGYHARAGSADAILCHTWTGGVADVTINGIPMGEIGINASVCGHFDVPVLMIAGDQCACAEAVELLGPVQTAIVKTATGRKSAECLPPDVTGKRIAAAAERALRELAAGTAPSPLKPESPITATIAFTLVEAAEKASLVPGSRRISNVAIEITAGDMLEMYRAFQAAVRLAKA